MALAIQTPKLRRMVEQLGPDETGRQIEGLLESKQAKPHEFELSSLFEAFCGPEALLAIHPGRKSGGRRLSEATDAVSVSAFARTTGQILVAKVLDAYETAADITGQLVESWSTTFMHGERALGVGSLGDVATVVGEGERFPEVGTSEEYVDFGAIRKRGFIVSLTKEIIAMERTGELLNRCQRGGEYMALNKMKRILDVVCGVTNTYKRNGVGTNTYLTSGAYINAHTNPLTTYQSIEAAELLFDGITDPTTGEPIVINGGMTVIVPRALEKEILNIIGATQIRIGDGASASIATYAPNPVGGRSYAVVTNPYVSLRSGSSGRWWIGQPRKSFAYRESWANTMDMQTTGSDAAFERDITTRYKFSEAGEPGVTDPRYMVQNNP